MMASLWTTASIFLGNNTAANPAHFIPSFVDINAFRWKGVSYGRRDLRGGRSGSYKGGGSSGTHYNGGSSNSNWNRNNGSRRGLGTFGRVLGGLAIGVLALALFSALIPGLGVAACGGCCSALLAGACCGLFAARAVNQSGSPYQSASTPIGVNGGQPSQDDMKFEEQAMRAKEEVESCSTYGGQFPSVSPHSGEYSTSYTDLGVHRTTTLRLYFTDSGNGFKLSGEGQDIDGTTEIEDGRANYDGNAWWREKTKSGDVGLQVLSRGKFNFQGKTFEGTWFSSTLAYGAYSSFRVTNVNSVTQVHPIVMHNAQTAGWQGAPIVTGTVQPVMQNSQTASGLQGDVPIITGAVVNPIEIGRVPVVSGSTVR